MFFFAAKKRKITSKEDDDASCSKGSKSIEVDSLPITQSYSVNKNLCDLFLNPQKRSESEPVNSRNIISEVASESHAPASTSILEDGDGSHENDIGRWVGRSFVLTTEKRMEMLKRCWVPPENYDFAGDATHLKRKFNHSWLEMYKPSLLKEIERCVLFVLCFISAESCTWCTGISNCSTIY